MLPPSEFIQVAEEVKLIDAISRWVMNEACRAATNWSRPLKIAVNISAIEFEEGNLVATISDALATSGLTPERLEIEITETVLMTNTDLVIDTLNSIRDLGVSVAMDDFGTGYSSLGYLCKFPFDKLKIDRSFLLSNDRQPQSKRIIEAIITLGHSLDLNVVAEGVEHPEQLAMLEALSCSEAQGFLLGKPMAAAAARTLVNEQNERTVSVPQNFSACSTATVSG
ncbi:MAG: EAL domain-containing protein [Geminicoccaceae bacterium]